VYHLQLRQFPHNLSRFNLTADELRVITEPWVRGEWVELGERKWTPHQAKLTILEGPRLELEQLSMSRGWRNAQRQSEDVTELVLAAAKEAGEALAAAAALRTSSSEGLPPAPPADEEMLSLLGEDPLSLLAAWRRVTADRPARSPSERLALAEAAVKSPGASPPLPRR
jgi:hypothetical protein